VGFKLIENNTAMGIVVVTAKPIAVTTELQMPHLLILEKLTGSSLKFY